MIRHTVFRLLFLVLCCAFGAPAHADRFDGVQQLLARRFPSLRDKVTFGELSGSGKEAFSLKTQNGRLLIRANSASAAAVGLNHYLNHFCHASLSHNADNLPATLRIVPIQGEVRVETAFRYRYALNYCTYNYTYSFYNWADFEREIDWMALNGINLMLAPMGMEKVWAETLRQLGFS